MSVAAAGVVVNAAAPQPVYAGRQGDMNHRGAYLRMAADAAALWDAAVAGH